LPQHPEWAFPGSEAITGLSAQDKTTIVRAHAGFFRRNKIVHGQPREPINLGERLGRVAVGTALGADVPSTDPVARLTALRLIDERSVYTDLPDYGADYVELSAEELDAQAQHEEAFVREHMRLEEVQTGEQTSAAWEGHSRSRRESLERQDIPLELAYNDQAAELKALRNELRAMRVKYENERLLVERLQLADRPSGPTRDRSVVVYDFMHLPSRNIYVDDDHLREPLDALSVAEEEAAFCEANGIESIDLLPDPDVGDGTCSDDVTYDYVHFPAFGVTRP